MEIEFLICLLLAEFKLKKDREILKYYTAKRVDREGIKWINKHPQYVKNIDGEIIVDKVCSVKSSVTYDTYENRLVKYIIKSIIKKLNLVKKNYEKESSIVDEKIKKSIEAMIYKLGRHLNYSFLKGVGDIYTMNSLSLVLNMSPGYKDVYKYYIMLLKGLMIREYIFKISMKDLAILYEYWCFIKLNSILREKYNLVKQGIIKFNNRGLTVTLTKGEETRVEYQNPKNGEIYSLVYNKKFKYDNIPTTPQMPDSILSLSKVGSNTIFKYVLDAKYKINPAVVDTDYYNKYRSPGPEEEDINTMHRYRDAIVYENKNNKKVILTFTSGLTAKNFFKHCRPEFLELLKEQHVVSIGPITKKNVDSFGFDSLMPEKNYTVEGMLPVIKALNIWFSILYFVLLFNYLVNIGELYENWNNVGYTRPFTKH